MTPVPADPDRWRSLVDQMRSNLEADLFKLVAFYGAPDSAVRVSVTKEAALVKLPDGSKLLLEDWLETADAA